ASGSVFLRVLQAALAEAAGGADLMLPKRPLGDVLPAPVLRWLEAAGATLRLGRRVERVDRDGDGWRLDGERFAAIVVAASAVEAARLVAPHAPAWAAQALALRHEPIATVYATSDGCVLPEPLVALHA